MGVDTQPIAKDRRMTNYQRIKEALPLKDYAEAHLQRGRERNTYICPSCKSGTGAHRTAALTIKNDRFKCFKCGVSGDVFDLIGIAEGIEEKREQLERAAELAGVNLQDAPRTQPRPKPAPVVTDYSQGIAQQEAYLKACRKRLKEQPTEEVRSYLQSRGYTLQEAIELGLGLDPEHPKAWKDSAGNWGSGARLVIPWTGSSYYHIDRAIDPRAAAVKYSKPRAEEVGRQPLYNPQFTDHKCVFVVEGALDALPIALLGYNSVALGGASNVNGFVSTVAERHYSGAVIDLLDADQAGREAAQKLEEALQDTQAVTVRAERYLDPETGLYAGKYKDIGDLFAADREQLAETLESLQAVALDTLNARRAEEYRTALRKLHITDAAQTAANLLDVSQLKEPIPTGLTGLDNALGGGFKPGELTFVGAISSYGKTTLVTQIADYIAAQGTPCLFVTIEQSAQEIVSKSVSRLIYTMNTNGFNLISPDLITDRHRRERWSSRYAEALEAACNEYSRTVAPYMHILEAVEQPNVNDIRTIAETVKEHAGSYPFVVVDYLQLLAPLDQYTSDKRTVDMNCSALRALARDTGSHVVCISSLNRSSYSGSISLDSFKESGSIEYSADVLIGLQPRGISQSLKGIKDAHEAKKRADQIIDESKSKLDRECELVILKRRNGRIPAEPIPVTFKTQCSMFV